MKRDTGEDTTHWLQLSAAAAGDRAVVVGAPEAQLADALRQHGLVVDTVEWSEAWTVQLPERATLAVVPSGLPPHAQQAALHTAVLHLRPRGFLVIAGTADERPTPPGLACVATDRLWALWQRTERRTVHDLVAAARTRVRRVGPHELHEWLQSAQPPTVLDTRSVVDRDRYGVIEGALHTPRTVLEFHLDPANGYLHPSAPTFDDPVVVVCNGGYSSSLAAANLADIGFRTVCDLIGGMAAWVGSGLPVTAPDHCHLELPLMFNAASDRPDDRRPPAITPPR